MGFPSERSLLSHLHLTGCIWSVCEEKCQKDFDRTERVQHHRFLLNPASQTNQNNKTPAQPVCFCSVFGIISFPFRCAVTHTTWKIPICFLWIPRRLKLSFQQTNKQKKKQGPRWWRSSVFQSSRECLKLCVSPWRRLCNHACELHIWRKDSGSDGVPYWSLSVPWIRNVRTHLTLLVTGTLNKNVAQPDVRHMLGDLAVSLWTLRG